MQNCNKQKYLSPRIEVLCVHNESLLAGASTELEGNGSLKKEDFPATPIEHNGGETEW